MPFIEKKVAYDRFQFMLLIVIIIFMISAYKGSK